MLTAFVLALALKDAACPLERAHYTLRGTAPGNPVTADLRDIPTNADWPHGIALRLKDKTHDHWFLPYGGNGQGLTTHLGSALPPDMPGWQFPEPDGGPRRPMRIDLDYIAASAGYDFDQGFTLRPGAPAPAHLLIPNLQYAFWYGLHEGMPYAFFDLTRCDP